MQPPTPPLRSGLSKNNAWLLQHTGVHGGLTDHAVEVVEVERRLDQDPAMELARVPGHLESLLAVTMIDAVR